MTTGQITKTAIVFITLGIILTAASSPQIMIRPIFGTIFIIQYLGG